MKKDVKYAKIVKKYEKPMLENLKSFVAINSVYDGITASETNPFGEGVSKALKFFEELAKKDGFKVTNYDNKVVEAILGEGMNEIMVKYIRPTLIEERKKKDRQKQLDLAAKMTTVLEMHEKGFTNQRIGEILGIPESTVRFFVKHKGGVKATGYTINKVEE